MRHIDGFVDLLKRSSSSSLDEKGLRYLKIISDAARAMGNLIDDLLLFSRMGRTEMRKTSVNIGRMIEDVIRDLYPETDGRNIAWKIGSLPEVRADPAMLRLVWSNLLSNALKYTRTRNEARIEIGGHEEPGEWIFFVRDNGVGFDMKYADRLFGVFQRLHSSSEFEGTGIGLANVRRIIHRHGGRTWADAVVNQGANFYFSLPKSLEGREESSGGLK